MATYISLMNFTDQGLRNVKDTTRRAEAAAKLGREYGVEFKSLHWTQGPCDLVAVFEAPDDAALAAFGLAAMSQGNFKSQTMRAFNAQEMSEIVARLP